MAGKTLTHSPSKAASRLLALLGLITLAVLLAAVKAAQAQSTSRPDIWKARVILVDGRGLGLVVNFDRPVDHGRSVLAIVSGGKVIRALQPRLESQPNTLFARTELVTPGGYALQWRVRSPSGEDIEQGDMPFTIVPAAPQPGFVVVAECE
jgi:hypothetical protein